MIVDNKFEYKLNKELEYGKSGQLESSNMLCFYEPTMKDYVSLLRMKPILSQSQTKMAVEFAKMAKDNDKKADDIIIELTDKEQRDNTRMVLDNCGNLDKYFELFKSLILKKGICLINDEEQMKEGYLDNISIHDMNNILFEYTHRFVFPKQV